VPRTSGFAATVLGHSSIAIGSPPVLLLITLQLYGDTQETKEGSDKPTFFIPLNHAYAHIVIFETRLLVVSRVLQYNEPNYISLPEKE